MMTEYAASHRRRQSAAQSRRRWAWAALVWFLVVPYTLVNLPWPVWQGRFWAIASFIIPGTAVIFWPALGGSVLGRASVFNTPRFAGVHLAIVGALRLVMLAVGVWFAHDFTIPFVQDGITLLESGTPTQLDGMLRSQRFGFRTPWFVERTVRFRVDGTSTTRDYFLYFSVRRLDAGRYTLTVLPSSRLILDVTPQG